MKLLASIRKELTLLLRDRAGLALLFVMPMALVLVVTLVQNNVLDARSQIDVLVLNEDPGRLGRAIEEGLRASDFFVARTTLEGVPLTSDLLHRAVARGRFRLGIVIHPQASRNLERGIDRLLEGAEPERQAHEEITLILDPAVQNALEDSIENFLQRLVQREQARVLLERLAQVLALPVLPASPLVEIRREYASDQPLKIKPNAVQHNVPAWTMFGIFFIAVPISSSLIRERNAGTLTRLFTMPVSFPTLLLGKILSHVVINLVQLALMLGVGLFVLPWFGTPVLSLGDHPQLILLVGLCASLAATGFGLMLGTLARTYEQASTVGPISIIIAAALGGIMVPVFLMPRFLQSVSAASPLRWGHEAFVDVFVRGADLAALIPNLSRLLLFFLVTVSVATLFFFREP
jgi:ABC-2 type transport system permease protein